MMDRTDRLSWGGTLFAQFVIAAVTACVLVAIVYGPLITGMMPHRHCYRPNESLMWFVVTMNLAIAGAYYALGGALVRYGWRYAAEAGGELPWLWGAFIYACGNTHIMAVITMFSPAYTLAAAVDTLTAAVSWVAFADLLYRAPRFLMAQRALS